MKILVRAHLSCYKFFIIYDQTQWIYNRRRKENNIRMISRKEGLYCEKAQKKHKLFSLTELRMDANIMTQRTFISASYAQCLHTTMPAESFCLGKSWSHIAHEGISHISVVCFVKVHLLNKIALKGVLHPLLPYPVGHLSVLPCR